MQLSTPSTAAQPTQRVLFLLLPHVNLLDLGGPAQVFASAAELGAAYTLEFRAHTPTIQSAQGLPFGPLDPLGVAEAADLVVIPGVSLRHYAASEAALPLEVRAWIQRAAACGAQLAAVCTGAFALGEARLLDGRRCTTHWSATAALQQRYPRAQVLDGVLYTHDAGVTTSAGVAAGIDMALSLVARDYGPRFVAQLARHLVVYLRRDGTQAQLSVYLQYRTHLHPGVHRAQDCIIAHLTDTLTVDQIAATAAMSVRSLTRAFREATGMTLVAYQQRLRLEFAANLLATSALSIEAVAQRTGFADARHFRRLWSRHFGAPPSTHEERRAPA